MPDTRMGIGLRRLVIVSLLVLSLLMTAALAVPTKANTETGTLTRIFIDGELVKKTRDENFTFQTNLSPGCHTVRVVQTSAGRRSVIEWRECSSQESQLTIEVNGGSVSFTVEQINMS